MKRPMILAAAGLAVLAAALFAACKVSASAETGPGVPIFGGSKVNIDIDGRKATPQLDPSGGYPQPGDCIRLHFKDADGKEIGTADVPAGGSADAPDGTEEVTWSPCDPPKAPKGKAKDNSWGGGMRVGADGEITVPFRTLPFRMEDGAGRWIDYSATAPSQNQAEALAQDFEVGALDRPRPQGIHTYGFSDVAVLRDGRVRVTVLTWREPTAFRLHWNGQTIAGGLDDATVTRTRGGWYASSVVVPASLVNFDQAGLPVTNEARYDVLTSEGRVDQTLAVTVTP